MTPAPLRVFIGFDPRETIAYHTLVQSILEHTSVPVSTMPLGLRQLGSVLTRRRDPKQSTDFAFSRFLVPSLCDYEGWALFLDCDMLARRDLAELWAERDDRYAVQVVKHDHRPVEDTKFLGQRQTRYPKKNWSSVMLFNNARCRRLTPAYVNAAAGLDLHQFRWLGNESAIGELPRQWNHLVGHDPADPDAAIVHFTSGGPWFDAYRDVEHADTWRACQQRAVHAGASALLPPAGEPPVGEGDGTHGR